MKIGLIGCGHLGKIHAKCIKEATNLEFVGTYDIVQETAKDTAEIFNINPFFDLQSLIENCEIVDIVSATVSHFELAKTAIMAGKHCFIEKPCTATVKEAEELIKLAEQYNVVVQVGHVERYNPAFLYAQPNLIKPYFIEAYRLGEFSPRGTDVSVVHDLMIHDIDLVLSIMQSELIDVQATGCKYITDTLDVANARLIFANGGIANMSVSRVATHSLRKMYFFQSENYISVNFKEKKAEKLDFSNGTSTLTEIPVIDHNAIVEELSDLFLTIQNKKTPKVTLKDGLNALSVADKVVTKILQKNYDL